MGWATWIKLVYTCTTCTERKRGKLLLFCLSVCPCTLHYMFNIGGWEAYLFFIKVNSSQKSSNVVKCQEILNLTLCENPDCESWSTMCGVTNYSLASSQCIHPSAALYVHPYIRWMTLINIYHISAYADLNKYCSYLCMGR